MDIIVYQGAISNLTANHVKIIASSPTETFMPLEARKIINSSYGLNVANLIGKYTPDWLGKRIAKFAADILSGQRDWKMVRAVRCNQWVARGETLDKHDLDQAVKENFRYIADAIFDLYHTVGDTSAVLSMIEPHATALQLVERPKFAARGMVVAGVHMSNFDLVFQMGGLTGLQALALTLPELSAGYRKQLEMRVKNGTQVLQASVGNIKYAIEYLKAGGLVFTGMDRPDESYVYRPKFFGRPAAVPIHHVFLALKARVPILVAATIKLADGKYHFMFTEPIEMQPHPDRQTEIILNAEMILQEAEKFIQRDPGQWSMTYPVWPEAMSLCV